MTRSFSSPLPYRLMRRAGVGLLAVTLSVAGYRAFADDKAQGTTDHKSLKAAPPAERATADPKVDPHVDRAYPAWQIHDMKRPKPPIVTPGTWSTQDAPGKPPSDAVILFDGKDLSKWSAVGGKDAPWKVEDGYMEAAGATIETREPIGDCQLHIEFATPNPPKGSDQGRGNSGILLMGGQYEVQVLDSYENTTYADGQAAAVYGQNPPMVNASRPPAQWQQYDILWRGPRFDKDGKLLRPASVTVMHNGVYVQDHWVLTGPTGHHVEPPYHKHPEKMPLQLQFHGNPTRYRNLWYRALPDEGYATIIEEQMAEGKGEAK